jgi:catechol 2,3-dioxygenase-like lactoylglutathione lyase family enzyme
MIRRTVHDHCVATSGLADEHGDVDRWYAFMEAQGVTLRTAPRTHRDGARSFYCEDPAGNVVQIIFHPPISAGGEG